MPKTTMFDDVANDLAVWIDETASKVALALAPRTSPFAVSLTEDQKLEIYTRQIFNPDGSPNEAGRQAQIARLGAEGFAQVFKMVIRAHPELKPQGPAPDSIDALAPLPPGGGPIMAPPGAPPGPGAIPLAPGPPMMPPPGPPLPPVPMGGP